MASQILTNRKLGGFDNMYSSVPMEYGFVPGPVSGTTTATEAFMQMYGLGGIPESVLNKVSVKSESGLSNAIPVVSRKRSRETAFNHHQQFVSVPSGFNDNRRHLLTEDFSLNFQRHQSEMDQIISQHTLKLRLEMEEKKKSYSRRIITAVKDVINKKLKAKDEEIEKISKLNWDLDEKVKSLFLENQIWRELAQTNEATANALRSNLEQVLTHVQEQQQHHHHQNAAATELADDAESCCGSNCVGIAGDKNFNNHRNTNTGNSCMATTSHGGGGRMCRNCGKEEATVLIMPCRHLCLCYLCGPLLHNCPICNSVKNVMVRVNLGC